jgi:hypothetical protein
MSSELITKVSSCAMGRTLETWVQPLHYTCEYGHEHENSQFAVATALTRQFSLANATCKRDKRHPLQRLTFIQERSKTWWRVDAIIELPRHVPVELLADGMFGSFKRPRHCERLKIGLDGLEEDDLKQLLTDLPSSNADVTNCRITSRSHIDRTKKRRFRPVDYHEHYIGDQILYRKRRSVPQ